MMADSDISKDWPTLSDSNGACASAVKHKHGEIAKERPKSSDSSSISATNGKENASDVKTDATDGSHVASSTSTDSANTGARRKKQAGKTKWSSVQINFPSYRDNRSDRYHNESHKYYGVNNNRRFNNYESANNYANGHHESSRGRPFRGGRGGRGGQFRSRRENNLNSNSPRYQAVTQENHSSLSPVEQQQVDSTQQNERVTFSEAITEQVMRQIEYYFSEKNLFRDSYLRFHMDEQGYADLTFIAEFPRMKRLTNNLQLILEAVKRSSHLEVSDDVKVRPVVDPLRWPLKDDGVLEASNVNEPFVDLISSQMYNMSLNPSVYPHIPGTKSPYELSWQYIPEQEENDAMYCVYPPVDSNGFSVAPIDADIPNGHVSPSQALDSPNSVELNCELPSQYIPNRYELKNGTLICPVTELPIESNGTNGIANDVTIPNRQDDVVPQTNGEAPSSDLKAKTPCHSCGCTDIDVIEEAIIATECLCSSEHDITYVTVGPNTNISPHITVLDGYNQYSGQMSNGVLLYNSGGHYYVPHSAENNTDSSDEKSTLQNKSPEPSR